MKFINAHCHLLYEKRTPQSPKHGEFSWFKEIIKISRNKTPEENLEIAKKNIQEALDTGTRYIVENSFSPEISLQAMREMKISGEVAIELFSNETEEEFLHKLINQIENKIKKLQDKYSEYQINLAPHSIYNVSGVYLQKISELAHKLDLKIYLHAAEFAFEDELVQNGRFMGEDAIDFYENFLKVKLPLIRGLGGGKSSVIKYLESLNILSSNLKIIHACNCSDEDLDILKKYKIDVISCPRSNKYLNNSKANLLGMKERNIKFQIATDSLASNDSLSLWDEIEFSKKLYPELSDDDLFRSIIFNDDSSTAKSIIN